ncbi:MAG: hypothetical protein HC893_04005 [Chloroflexaceae bacterium]|nr:hypothetical protein [Chloroflexaceae bacterium]NJL33155.1 hypothetical protein [Chloroflexaceae bacterium]NJO05396.1 hypothetical protein [Chloroflexaceae bacterium]
MELTQAIGPITPNFLCWTSLIVTVVALVTSFYFTNITAFAERLRGARRKPTSGSAIGRPIKSKHE